MDEDEFPPKPLSVVYIRLVFEQGDLCDATFSQHVISLDDFGGVSNVSNGDAHTGEQLTFRMNLASCCSQQMDVPKSIDVIMNVMPPIVFWNMIVSVVVVSWCGQGLTMIDVLI